MSFSKPVCVHLSLPRMLPKSPYQSDRLGYAAVATPNLSSLKQQKLNHHSCCMSIMRHQGVPLRGATQGARPAEAATNPTSCQLPHHTGKEHSGGSHTSNQMLQTRSGMGHCGSSQLTGQSHSPSQHKGSYSQSYMCLPGGNIYGVAYTTRHSLHLAVPQP